jgi:hypothetical protein
MTDTRPSGPFDTLEGAFRLLCAGPKPLSLDGGQVPGLPDRPIPLDELRAILLHPSTPYPTRNAAIAVLVAEARSHGGTATVGLAGVLLFGLRRAISVLSEVCPARSDDFEAEALAGLLEGIAATDPGRGRLAARLCWLARNRAKRLFVAELSELQRHDSQPDTEAPRHPWAHPDLVLDHAVAEGVICADDAALIGDTRLGLFRLADAADGLGIGYPAARKRRARAEAVLAEWLRSDRYQRDFVPNRARDPYLAGGGRPRGGRNPRPAAEDVPTVTDRRR